MRATGMKAAFGFLPWDSAATAASREGRACPARGAEAITDAATGLADLAGHGGNRDAGPPGLFAVNGALQGPADGDERTACGELTGKRANPAGVEAGDLSRPFGGLGRAVGLALQVGRELVEATAAAGEEIDVGVAGGEDLAGDADEQGGVGVGSDGPPFGADPVWNVVASWRDVHNAGAAVLQSLQVLAQHMATHAAQFDLRRAWGERAQHGSNSVCSATVSMPLGSA